MPSAFSTRMLLQTDRTPIASDMANNLSIMIRFLFLPTPSFEMDFTPKIRFGREH